MAIICLSSIHVNNDFDNDYDERENSEAISVDVRCFNT